MAPVVRVAVAMVCLTCGCASVSGSSKTATHPQVSLEAQTRQRSTSTKRVRSERPADEAAAPLAVTDSAGVEHQVRMLRKSIELYGQFIERAAGQPEMKEAVQRSRERIRDAEETIWFLLQGSSPAR